MQPAVVIVHGAWHVPHHYELFGRKLQEAGYDIFIPHLPSCGKLAAQSTIHDDISVLRDQLNRLVEDSRTILIVAHSYGGAVATQAVEGSILHRDRQAQGLSGGIIHLIYMCAFALQPGQSCLDASQPRPDPDPVEPGDDGTSFLSQPGRALFYNDIHDEEILKRSEDLLVRHSLAALAAPISYPAWKYLPSTYLKCTLDRVLFPNWQDQLVQAMRESGSNIDVEVFQASHSPFLSMPEKMVSVVNRIAESYHL